MNISFPVGTAEFGNLNPGLLEASRELGRSGLVGFLMRLGLKNERKEIQGFGEQNALVGALHVLLPDWTPRGPDFFPSASHFKKSFMVRRFCLQALISTAFNG